MLIADAHHPDLLASKAFYAKWEQPHCAYLYDGIADDRIASELEEKGFRVFDLTTPPASRLAVMREIVLTMMHNRFAVTGPVLLLGPYVSKERYAEMVKHAKNDEFALEYDLSPETGDINSILLGTGIVQNPLFRTYLENMAPGLAPEHVKASIELVETHLV